MKAFYLFFMMVLMTACAQEKKKTSRNESVSEVIPGKKPEADQFKIKKKAEEALKYCTSKNFNTDFCILIDMSLHSGIKRFFVWDFKNKCISKKYLVGHGCGSNSWGKDDSRDRPEFSNEEGSHLSSLGKYKLQGRGYSEWGINIKYLMHGLEETNDNALERFIVFHSWDLMSDEETFPKGSPEGWGCPTISNNAMKEIDPVIQNSKKPVLMWIYN
ncbi:murein L,D-transpeptidase catalytic domain-containing protein [Chryseobacterium sp. NRRL B-14859]|uniref:murein L,D-transpeptidase catalytic domain-containing protein n=1 Tax=Chryseobacterium sp. NRRL B-14859 TaxID=1562763 RepID=UPI003390E50E